MSDRTTDTSVLIIGGGPTGLALTCDLARRGIDFRIIDKAPAYFAGSRGKGLQPRGLEVLDDFGVVDQILANGRFHLPFRAYEGARVIGDRDIHEGRNPTPDVPYASSLIIPQWRVEEILRSCLEAFGHRVELGVELTEIEQNEDQVIATLSGAGRVEHTTAKFLVGADGGHSFVRHTLGVGFEGETWTTERMYVGDVKVDTLDRNHWHVWPDKMHGFLGLCPLPSTDSFQFQAQIAPDEEGEPSLERFQQIVDQRASAMNLRLHDASWTSLFRANIRMVDRYRVGRIFLAGDAAHVHSPAGGQGMNTGIQDAYNLGWKLALVLRGAPDWLLDTYEQERLPVAARILGITSKLHREMMPKETLDAGQRDAEFLQLGIRYRGGRLARELRSKPTEIQAGDRAPDSPCRSGDGTPVRIFDLLRGPHFTLLQFGPDFRDANEAGLHVHRIVRPGELPDASSVVDSEGHAYRVYGVSKPTQFLVRPDGYVGLITESLNDSEVRQYLKELSREE